MNVILLCSNNDGFYCILPHFYTILLNFPCNLQINPLVKSKNEELQVMNILL